MANIHDSSGSQSISRPPQDTITKVLIWVMLAVTIGCWSGMIWGTVETYEKAAPLPDSFVTPSGETVMTRASIVAGKSGFQKADLMDYGSLYGMGSYYGEDYTAEYLVALGKETQESIAQARYESAFASLTPERQHLVKSEMQDMLHGIDLSKGTVVLPAEVAEALKHLQASTASKLLANDAERGYTKAYSLSPEAAANTADFLLYSAMTTVAYRPGKDYSWTIGTF